VAKKGEVGRAFEAKKRYNKAYINGYYQLLFDNDASAIFLDDIGVV
jgi:hypothetical protein